ncbi:hypothetical protein K505DRAFT_361440 [Melanomma pulvis-pyrius CBS 109.77]|uniref:Uncharacterized protein n=1 Tax=Melanomma pulvis-pyrius CBS 109.77 TaxID=1314802 RepID=A0A6A6XCA2_9PLEO|nr:hypothetical protein K505DRAFT_361440 [Melanomma pulvis-pyrius CBS 109.77]
MDEGYLRQSNEKLSAACTAEYQDLVGSLACISYTTRPGVAKSHLTLSQHLQNLCQKHLVAVRKVWKFLLGTQWRAICTKADVKDATTYMLDCEDQAATGIEPLFFGASDTASNYAPKLVHLSVQAIRDAN